jgi:hypothetical protein
MKDFHEKSKNAQLILPWPPYITVSSFQENQIVMQNVEEKKKSS